MKSGCASGFAENEPWASIFPSARALGAALSARASDDIRAGRTLAQLKLTLDEMNRKLRDIPGDGGGR